MISHHMMIMVMVVMVDVVLNMLMMTIGMKMGMHHMFMAMMWKELGISIPLNAVLFLIHCFSPFVFWLIHIMSTND